MAILLGACANPREEAREELRKLRTALDEHRARYGRYPESIDPGRPASEANLALQPRDGVSLELVHAGADGFQALARRRPWICTMNVDARGAERMRCAPLGNSDAPPDSGSRATPLDSMLHTCPVTPSFTQLGDTKIYAAISSGIRDSSGGSERGVAELAAP